MTSSSDTFPFGIADVVELLASGEYTDIHIYSILKEEVLANLKR